MGVKGLKVHSKVVHSEDSFSDEGLFESWSSKSSFSEQIMQICGSSCYK